jgi:anti-anti-sigma regulatory factor
MATSITQMDDPERDKTVLRIEGEMSLDDAELLERIALGLRAENGKNLTLDLSDLGFLDSEAAPVLKRLTEIHGFEIEGLQFFVQKIIDETERR